MNKNSGFLSSHLLPNYNQVCIYSNEAENALS
jgi:hypothetical protein